MKRSSSFHHFAEDEAKESKESKESREVAELSVKVSGSGCGRAFFWMKYGFVWKCRVAHFPQWFCWSLSRF